MTEAILHRPRHSGPRLFPQYAGAKIRWISRLERFRGEDFVEPFAGSAAISFALARRALWNDANPVLANILRRFDQLVVPPSFGPEDYEVVRYCLEWWRYSYCLARFSFAGKFLASPRAFGTKGYGPGYARAINLRPTYEAMVARWRELSPEVTCGDYSEIPLDRYVDKVVVLDPPYEGCRMGYVAKISDYPAYWRRVREISEVAKATLVFDFDQNIQRNLPGVPIETRVMRPVGAGRKTLEAMALLERRARVVVTVQTFDPSVPPEVPVRLLPGFVGSKARWVARLDEFRGRDFVEPFAGSAAISFGLAGRAFWNEQDPILAKILRRFDEQVVPDVFTIDDYLTVRGRSDWWRYAFCLMKMSYARVFRYSAKSGFNVPPGRDILEIHARPEYDAALKRWRELRPLVTCGDWSRIKPAAYKGKVVILDPPFQGSHTPYNNVPDYEAYWRAVTEISRIASATIVFDYEEKLRARLPGAVIETRRIRPNGKRAGRMEAMAVLKS